MSSLRFASLALASALLLQGACCTGDSAHETPSATPTPTVSHAKCLTQMNEARKAVGFSEFKEDTNLLPPNLTEPSEKRTAAEGVAYWQGVCKAIQKPQEASPAARDSSTPEVTTPSHPDGTYAYFGEAGESENCSAAVENWKGGFTLIGSERPGKFTSGKEGRTTAGPFNSTQTVSFAALYNPNEGAKAHCVFLTCPEQQAASGDTRATAPKATALVCLSSPKALEDDKEPYTEEQWNQILGVFAPNSASVAAPAFLALAAAAVGLAYF